MAVFWFALVFSVALKGFPVISDSIPHGGSVDSVALLSSSHVVSAETSLDEFLKLFSQSLGSGVG